MRIIATCDLHYNIARSRAPTEAIARAVCRAGGDVLLLLGDLAGIDLGILERTFALFEPFRGPRLFVAGNHELWAPPGGDSLDRYQRELPALCRRCGVHPLDEEPYVDGDAAVAGTVGWYDYSFRAAELGIPLRFYEHKLAPGSAEAREGSRHLVEGAADVPEPVRRLVCRWMDGEHVRLHRSDGEFARETAGRLREHLRRVGPGRRVLVGTHHLPFDELVPPARRTPLRFASAFLGSARLGEAILEFPGVRHVLCGHSHHFAQCRRGAVTATAIGSTYAAKRYEVVDL